MKVVVCSDLIVELKIGELCVCLAIKRSSFNAESKETNLILNRIDTKSQIIIMQNLCYTFCQLYLYILNICIEFRKIIPTIYPTVAHTTCNLISVPTKPI